LGLTGCAQTPPAPATVPVRVSTSIAVAVTSPVVTPTPLSPVATPTPGSGPGAVSGRVCYPGSFNPAVNVTFRNNATGAETALAVPAGQAEYRQKLPPGEYVAYARTTGTGLEGSYSQAVPCGLTSDCPDHNLRPFTVPPGGEVSRIDLCDWSRRPGVTPRPAGGPVTVTTVQNMQVFSATGLVNPPLQTLPAAITAPAVGRSADGLWLQIKPPTGAIAWIFAPLLQINGDPATLPVVGPAEAPAGRDQFTPESRWSYSPNAVVGRFAGYLRNQQGQPVNGYSLFMYNGTWSALTHPSGPSHHYPNYAPGQWDMVFYNPIDTPGWWSMMVVRYDCPNFDQGFNAQCKQFTPVSSPKVVKLVFPDATVLEGNWICRRDCDQGLYH